MRQVVFDTETTGLDPLQGHRVIEIGCVEVINRRVTKNHFHTYIRPDREVDKGALAVHGITDKFLLDKPRFHEIADDFVAFINGSELIAHNASFDVGFINSEFQLLEIPFGKIEDYAKITDTLAMARKMYPGKKNNLDALCKRLDVDNSNRDLHGALLDSEILARVFLAMTGGQDSLFGGDDKNGQVSNVGTVSASNIRRVDSARSPLPIIRATEEEQAAHDEYFK